MWRVNRYWTGGVAGIADTAFFQSAREYADRFGAPQAVKDVVAFRHALAAWDFPAAAGASDRLLPVVAKENQWISGDELRDGAVMAKLHLGDAAGARVALDSLRRFSSRSPDDLRTRMLEAYVTTAEGRQATAAR